MTDSEHFFRYYGGSLDLLDKKGIKEWMPTVIKDPWLFRGNLKPIYELISNATKKTNMKLAVQVHLDKAYLTVRHKFGKKSTIQVHIDKAYFMMSDKI